MWSDEELNKAIYTAFHDADTKQPLGVGQVEIGGAKGGIYMLVPGPPMGCLGSEQSSIAGYKGGVTCGRYEIAYVPRSIVAISSGETAVHDFGNLVP